MVDRIVVLNNGRIVEQGCHTELLNMNGEYAQLFNMQAEQYR
jgi:ABC-type multidrug transport system fused ATPase/permease subunit